MKKTFIILSLALAGVASATAGYQQGDITYTTQNPAHTSHPGDALSRQTYFTFTLTESLFDNTSGTITTASNGDIDYSSTYNDSLVALSSITLWAKDENSATPATLSIYTMDGSLLLTSTSKTDVSTTDPCSHAGATYGFTFDADNLLTVGTTYKVTFSSTALAATNTGTSGFSQIYTYTAWQPAMLSIVTTSVVPEPATATLSLLALAGLAARRRRK